MRSLEGKVAIVTGMTRDMGESIAARLARDGAAVVGCGRNLQLGEQVASRIRALGGRCLFVHGDVAEPSDVAAVVTRSLSEFGSIDVVVNNAAAVDLIRAGDEGAALDESLESFDHQLAVGVRGPFLVAQQVIPFMMQAGGGAFVSISAWNATRAVPGVTAYAIAKSGLEALDRQIALDYGRYGIRANSVLVGMIRVAQNAALHDSPTGADIRRHVQMLPIVGRPEDIASAVAFLASDEARFVTGSTIAVDGGAISKGGFPAELFAQYRAGLQQIGGTPE